ncbi:antibiotic biosynthesis monooxygenase family protein [Mesorhizobium shangrilense]|uniref:Antibiotic biosynthesis monooxygenase family protein n=1 Tax=Mesorhizobium shangrilense TaxID=460060 RepID=A0ABV2DBV7_9HYPH
MPIIRANTGVITQINVFTVPEGGQQALIGLLREAAASCRAVPGWMSASLHRGLDGSRVVNYAQARDEAAMRRVFKHLQENGFLERNKALGQAHPGLYEVAITVE